MCFMNDAQKMSANGEVRPPICFIYSADIDFNYGLSCALNVADKVRICHCFTDRRDIFRRWVRSSSTLEYTTRISF
jgi:hypothetical protein